VNRVERHGRVTAPGFFCGASQPGSDNPGQEETVLSGDFLVEELDSFARNRPEGFAIGAFEQVVDITVGMDVDFNPGDVSADGALHGSFSFQISVCVLNINECTNVCNRQNKKNIY
jgi:hypothetical protein